MLETSSCHANRGYLHNEKVIDDVQSQSMDDARGCIVMVGKLVEEWTREAES